MIRKKKICEDCGMPYSYHTRTWIEEIANQIFPYQIFDLLPQKTEMYLDVLMEKFFILFRLARFQEDFDSKDIQLRSKCFIDEAEKKGIKFKALKSFCGFTNYFQMKVGNKVFRFESLPAAEFLNKKKSKSRIVDDKELTKRALKQGGFPFVESKSFWFFQRRKAIEYGSNKLGFPLVVKPRSGSVSRHVTTDIRNVKQLRKAINKSIEYSPVFIIERFVSGVSVYRATVIDFDFTACAREVSANVVGDGVSTIDKLIKEKNNDSRRGDFQEKESILHKIIKNKTTKKLLEKKNYDFSTVLDKGEIIFLQKNPFLRFGGDLEEVTPRMHPDNLQLFQDIAKFFDIRVVGIDFLIPDISVSWQSQPCAVLELNPIPCIEIHHFPYSGKPQNIGMEITNMVLKHYI